MLENQIDTSEKNQKWKNTLCFFMSESHKTGLITMHVNKYIYIYLYTHMCTYGLQNMLRYLQVNFFFVVSDTHEDGFVLITS